MTNKLLYGAFGAKDLLEHSCAGLHRSIRIYADGVRQTIPPEAEGIILLNINSFAGGVRMWERDGAYGCPRCRTAWWTSSSSTGVALGSAKHRRR